MIINFLSNRLNLSVVQFILYSMLVYAMSQYGMNIGRIILFIIVVWGIQFIARIKAIADGLVMRQLMLDHKLEANEIIERIKKQAEEDRKNDNIN